MWKMDNLHHPIGFSRALTLTLMLIIMRSKWAAVSLPVQKDFLFFSHVIGLANSTVEKSCMSLSKNLSAAAHILCGPWLLLTAMADHSSHSFPLPAATAENPLNNRLSRSASQPILSVVPTIGPLHISLNSTEHVLNPYHSFFKTVYEATFPGSKLADTLSPGELV